LNGGTHWHTKACKLSDHGFKSFATHLACNWQPIVFTVKSRIC